MSRQQLLKLSIIMTMVYTFMLAAVLYGIKTDLFVVVRDLGHQIGKELLVKATDIEETLVEQSNEQVEEEKQNDVQTIKEKVLIDAPTIPQLPELERGCEVTSLAMLLNYADINVNKLELAKKLAKDPAPLLWKNGLKFFGNPYYGFVGDIYDINKPGYGVYHEPIKVLAETYLPHRIIDFTGAPFEQVIYHLDQGKPVWVIINTEYRALPDKYFETWYTTEGPVTVTFKEHSVLVTGYDQEFIYFNDPLTNTKNKKAPIADFKAAWMQMGQQAITFVPTLND